MPAVSSGLGGAAAEATGNQFTAASLEICRKVEKYSMSKTKSVTPETALELLESAINYCQAAGIQVTLMPIHEDGEREVIISIRGVRIRVDGHLAINGKGGAE
jgi:hypothetical protein